LSNIGIYTEGEMQVSDNTNDDFLFIDDSDEEEILASTTVDTWKILIVDDDPEIHSVTQLALSELIVLGRSLEYLHAYSGSEACKILEENPEIVVVLLDVVMETDDAGLKVVKYIRENLARHDIRIVLRTGQPGYAPEENVIKDYDINDYKTKTELTRRKLVTTVYAAIRSYQQIQHVNQNRVGLEKIITASSELLEQHTIHSYANDVLKQLAHLIGNVNKGVFCARGQGILTNVDDLSFYILGQFGSSTIFIDQKVSALKDPLVEQKISNCYARKSHDLTSENIALYLANGRHKAVIYLALETPLSPFTKQLVEVFIANVSVGYENVHLFHQLRDAAYKDVLTGLPNRLAFLQLLDQFVSSDDDNLVAALVDLNHFSDINDGLGQDIGNQLLIAVAKRLKTLGSDVQVTRIGADVFGLIGSKVNLNPTSLQALFEQLFVAGEQSVPLSACFGLCSHEEAGSEGKKVLNQINIALNLAKKDRQNHLVYYQQEMEDKTLWRLSMIRQLRTDFADNRLALWYQPQLNLSSGKVIGAEALLRWRTAEGKYISPAVFIPLAEYSGLIIEIGDWVIEQACLQIKALEQQGFYDVAISVNVSIPQFRRGDFAQNIIEKINKYHVEPKKLELEITENILMDDPQIVIDALVKLKQQGLRIALDDFGTGYSSLSYLQQLPLDRLKVDRAFVTNITKPENSIIADTIISLGKKMHLNVIAEGVEDKSQEIHLLNQGCDDVQGYFYAKPMPAEEFVAYLKKT
jgi:diguanylate cyclase (GGDEF)-like protein